MGGAAVDLTKTQCPVQGDGVGSKGGLLRKPNAHVRPGLIQDLLGDAAGLVPGGGIGLAGGYVAEVLQLADQVVGPLFPVREGLLHPLAGPEPDALNVVDVVQQDGAVLARQGGGGHLAADLGVDRLGHKARVLHQNNAVGVEAVVQLGADAVDPLGAAKQPDDGVENKGTDGSSVLIYIRKTEEPSPCL